MLYSCILSSNKSIFPAVVFFLGIKDSQNMVHCSKLIDKLAKGIQQTYLNAVELP